MNTKHTKSDLKALQHLRNLRQVRQFLGLSQSELAENIPSVKTKKKAHIKKQSVSGWEHGKQVMAEAQLWAVARLLAIRLSNRYRREIGVRILVNSPWHITAHYWCSKCRQYHELKTARQKCKRGKAK